MAAQDELLARLTAALSSMNTTATDATTVSTGTGGQVQLPATSSAPMPPDVPVAQGRIGVSEASAGQQTSQAQHEVIQTSTFPQIVQEFNTQKAASTQVLDLANVASKLNNGVMSAVNSKLTNIADQATAALTLKQQTRESTIANLEQAKTATGEQTAMLAKIQDQISMADAAHKANYEAGMRLTNESQGLNEDGSEMGLFGKIVATLANPYLKSTAQQHLNSASQALTQKAQLVSTAANVMSNTNTQITQLNNAEIDLAIKAERTNALIDKIAVDGQVADATLATYSTAMGLNAQAVTAAAAAAKASTGTTQTKLAAFNNSIVQSATKVINENYTNSSAAVAGKSGADLVEASTELWYQHLKEYNSRTSRVVDETKLRLAASEAAKGNTDLLMNMYGDAGLDVVQSVGAMSASLDQTKGLGELYITGKATVAPTKVARDLQANLEGLVGTPEATAAIDQWMITKGWTSATVTDPIKLKQLRMEGEKDYLNQLDLKGAIEIAAQSQPVVVSELDLMQQLGNRPELVQATLRNLDHSLANGKAVGMAKVDEGFQATLENLHLDTAITPADRELIAIQLIPNILAKQLENNKVRASGGFLQAGKISMQDIRNGKHTYKISRTGVPDLQMPNFDYSDPLQVRQLYRSLTPSFLTKAAYGLKDALTNQQPVTLYPNNR